MIYKFSAKWCSSCLITNKNFTKLITDYNQYETNFDYQEIDVDSQKNDDLELLNQFEINENSVLPIILFKDQNQVIKIVGEKDRNELITFLDQVLTVQNKASPSGNFSKSKLGFLSNLSQIFK